MPKTAPHVFMVILWSHSAVAAISRPCFEITRGFTFPARKKLGTCCGGRLYLKIPVAAPQAVRVKIIRFLDPASRNTTRTPWGSHDTIFLDPVFDGKRLYPVQHFTHKSSRAPFCLVSNGMMYKVRQCSTLLS